MRGYRAHFRGKHVTVMGLGLLGRGVRDVRFLSSSGARITVTDLKSARELAPSVRRIPREVELVLGRHRLKDFRGRDFVLKAAGVPLESPYIAEARRTGVRVEMDESLFARLAPGVRLVGVTGTRGKTTVASLLHAIFQAAGVRSYLAGNVRDTATLPLLRVVRPDDTVVLELSSWQLQGFGEARISPQIAVFTTFMSDHMNYYRGDRNRYFADKTEIFRHQSPDDVVVAGPAVARVITRRFGRATLNRLVVASPDSVPRRWRIGLPGAHNRLNVALAREAALRAGVDDGTIREAVAAFAGAPDRLQTVAWIAGARYVNDTTATIPEATIAALETFPLRRVVLIAGGADKGLRYGRLASAIATRAKAVVLLPGTATDKLARGVEGAMGALSMPEAVALASGAATAGDVVLLAPGAASFGVFANEFDRGAQFVRAVQQLGTRD